jgi:tRNA nucleotidyltransferase/poly(A) polymerase
VTEEGQLDRRPSCADFGESPGLSPEVLSWRLSQRLQLIESFPRFCEALASFPGADFFLYGGALRDEALGRVPQGPFDLDIIIGTDTLDELTADLKRDGTIDVGRLFGNLRWKPAGPGAATYDFQALAKYNRAKPCRDITEILRQVDFTGNALAYNFRTGEIVDPLNGLTDLNARVMRAVQLERETTHVQGLALPLQATIWFRILHFASALDLTIEHRTAQWIVDHSHYRVYEAAFRREFFVPCLTALESL